MSLNENKSYRSTVCSYLSTYKSKKDFLTFYKFSTDIITCKKTKENLFLDVQE